MLIREGKEVIGLKGRWYVGCWPFPFQSLMYMHTRSGAHSWR